MVTNEQVAVNQDSDSNRGDERHPRLNPLLTLGEARAPIEAATLVPAAPLLLRAPVVSVSPESAFPGDHAPYWLHVQPMALVCLALQSVRLKYPQALSHLNSSVVEPDAA